jgi:hypothetical protein
MFADARYFFTESLSDLLHSIASFPHFSHGCDVIQFAPARNTPDGTQSREFLAESSQRTSYGVSHLLHGEATPAHTQKLAHRRLSELDRSGHWEFFYGFL